MAYSKVFSEIHYDVSDKIATITLNRPDKLNAWTGTMEQEVRAALIEASGDDGVGAIILTGAGRGFCSGADMNNLNSIQEGAASGGQTSDSVRAVDNAIPGGLSLSNDYSLRYTYFPTVPKPIIAAINGPAAGLGLIMALYCDVRFASDAAVFSTAFARRGLIAEHGISWMLPTLIGPANALDITLSGRKFNAAEAKEMGLVSKVYPMERFMDDVRAYAVEMATLASPRSIRVMKRQLYQAMLNSLEHSVLLANSEMPASFESEDFKEGVAHFVERRAPNFTGR
ncbi:MAG: enoyl-CoA hydratase [Alphaproteobacteria bacterium]|nr:enoyl-CoA hydratase [Alphaproteobacteria bacterium]